MKTITTTFFLVSVVLSAVAQTSVDANANYLTYDEARSVINSLTEELPTELRKPTEAEQRAAWNQWIRQKDKAIRTRLAQGDEDSLINLLLFGTSFTKQPRILFAQIQKSDESLNHILQSRLDDFIYSLEKPNDNERVMFARRVLIDGHGFKTTTEIERNKLKLFILKSLQRMFQENEKYKQIIETARLQNDPTFEFAERSKLFKTRGLSSDTVTQPNFAIEQALKQLKDRGLILPEKMIRIGVVGPGLDFTDKQEGYDFYPLQTIQPFALIDTLVKLGLADKKNIRLTTLDISPRINLHIHNMRQTALKGKPYLISLPKDKKVSWTPEFLTFWKTTLNQIGREKRESLFYDIADLRVVEINSLLAAKVTPADVNIVLQSMRSKPNEKFDLIIATNILVYYNSFEQSLAMLNIEKMLKPGGLFLSNDAVIELKDSKVRSIGYTGVVYSSRSNDGDTIVWYQRMTK